MINNLFKVVLDSHTSLDYKHKRNIINATLNKATLNEMVDIAVNYLTAFLSAAPALNEGSFAAAISIASPVLGL